MANESSNSFGYDKWGRVELTTLTKEFFFAALPRTRRSHPPRPAHTLRLGRRS